MKRFRVEIWDRKNTARQAIFRSLPALERKRVLGGEEALNIRVDPYDPGLDSLTRGAVLRVQEVGASAFTLWRYAGRKHERTAENALQMTIGVDALWMDFRHGMLRDVQADGRTLTSFGLLGLTPTEWLEEYILPGYDGDAIAFAVGTIERTDPVDLDFEEASPLEALRLLEREAMGEVQFRLNAAGDTYLVDILEYIGEAVGAEIRYGKNIEGITREEDEAEVVTRLYAKGADGLTLADARWTIASIAGNTITFEDANPVFEDSAFVGDGADVPYIYFYAGGSARRITASDASAGTMTLDSAAGLSVGDEGWFATDVQGTRLAYLESPSARAESGVRVGPPHEEDVPNVANLLENGDLAQWAAGTPVGWSVEGAPAVSQESSPIYGKNGGKSAHVVATAADEGLVSDPIEISEDTALPYYSILAGLTIVSGRVRMELRHGDGSIYPIQEQAQTTGEGVYITLRSYPVHAEPLPDGTAELAIVAHEGPAEWYLDAGLVTRTIGEIEPQFLPGSGAHELWQRTADELAFLSEPKVEYTVDVANLHQADPARYPFDQLGLGDDVRVRDPEIGRETLRIVEITEDLVDAATTRVSIALDAWSRPNDPWRVGAKRRRRSRRPGTPGGPSSESLASLPGYSLHNLRLDPDLETDTHYALRFDAGSLVEEVHGAARVYAGTVVTDAMQDEVRGAVAHISDGSGVMMIPKPADGEFTVCALVPIVMIGGVSRQLGWIPFVISGDRALIIPIGPFFEESADGRTSIVRLGIIDPRGVTGTPITRIQDVTPDGEETSAAMVLEPSTARWEHTFDLDLQHIRMVSIDIPRMDGGPTLTLGPFPADSGKVAQVFDVRLTFDGNGGAIVDADFDTDQDPTHDSGGAQYSLDGEEGPWNDLSVIAFQATWVVAMSELGPLELWVRAVNKAGEWGPAFGPVAIPQWIEPPPHTVEIPENAAGDAATARISFDDPLDVITAVGVEVVGVGFDPVNEPEAGVETAGWWERPFDLPPKHGAFVYFHVDRSNGPSYRLGPYGSDSNKQPNVTAGPSVEYDQEGTGYTSIQYDSDGHEYRYRVETEAGVEVLDWSTYAALVNFAALFPVAQSEEEPLVVKIQARSAGGIESEISDIGLEQWVRANPDFKITTEENAAGSQGTIHLEPIDPYGVVDTITVHRFALGIEIVVAPVDVTWDGTKFSHTFDLLPKPHNVLVWVEVQRSDSMPNYWLPIQTFDSNKAADVRELKATYDGAGTASATARFDTDTAIGLGEARYRLDGGAWVDDELVVGADRTAVFDVPQTTSPQLLEVAGRNASGAWGDPAPLEIEAYDPDPELVAASCFAAIDGSGDLEFTINIIARNASGFLATVDLYRDSVWVADLIGLDPEAGPYTYVDPGGPATGRVYAVVTLIGSAGLAYASVTTRTRPYA